jgi:hypothetical protein
MSKDNVLRSTMGLMARDNDNEAIIALRQATRMLKARGLDWSAIANLAIAAANDNSGPRAGNGHSTRPQPKPEPKPQPKPEPKPQPKPKAEISRFEGDAIPAVLYGDVVIRLRKRTRSGGRSVEFDIRNGSMVFGPIIAYRQNVTDALEAAALSRTPVQVVTLTRGEGRAASAYTPFTPQAGQVYTI